MIDLRLPETQDWFTRTFVPLELRGKKSVAERTGMHFLNPMPEIDSFRDLLPVVLGLDTGGGITFAQAIGLWLRRHEVNGLIFPSARPNPSCHVEEGVASAWSGWNLVVYAGADDRGTEDLFGFMGTWRDADHDHPQIRYEASGPHRGSLKMRGTREFNLVRFDLETSVRTRGARAQPGLPHYWCNKRILHPKGKLVSRIRTGTRTALNSRSRLSRFSGYPQAAMAARRGTN